jgi:hypothetical protein
MYKGCSSAVDTSCLGEKHWQETLLRDIAGPKYQRESIGLQHERRVCDPKIDPNAERLLWTRVDKLAPKRSMPSNANTPADVYGQLQLSSKNIIVPGTQALRATSSAIYVETARAPEMAAAHF